MGYREEDREPSPCLNINTDDVNDWKQRTMFDYYAGIRKCYQFTEKDPYVVFIVNFWGMTIGMRRKHAF